MFDVIFNDVKNFAEPDFANWLKPFINFDNYKNEILLGVRAKNIKQLAKKYKEIDDMILLKLLHNNCHDLRLLAIHIMVLKAKYEPDKMCKIYLENLNFINNWDLIDYSAYKIVAPCVSKNVLRQLANSDYLWANRVAVVSNIYYIKKGDFELIFEFAKKYLKHNHHLIHKAVGWMLREVGKQNKKSLMDFLEKYENKMPSVMRSYAKERL